MTPKSTDKPFTLDAPAAGDTWANVLRVALSKGVPHKAIREAYVNARYASYRAMAAHKGKDDKALTSFLRKHANNHLKLALADLNPMTREEKLRVATARETRLTAALAKAQATRKALAPTG